jgi:NADP-dependent aldehyde dehydrogenase
MSTDYIAVSETSGAELDELLASAEEAAPPWDQLGPTQRATALRNLASALDNAAESLVSLAQQETNLAEGRCRSELGRTTFQLRLFADVIDEGTYLEATIDSVDENWPSGNRPDLRRMLVPMGPVLVFAASNFPFAFSVAGGDTASALASGCPVIVKAHPGHPQLSAATAQVVAQALRDSGAPDGTFSMIYGDESARTALTDSRVTAAAFTGSLRAGRALFDLAVSRTQPIPFYAEMGSLNPVFVTERAADSRGDEVFAGFVDSYTLGVGQFCTKPGLLFAPAQSNAENVIAEAVKDRSGAPLLNERVERGYSETLEALSNHPALRTVVQGKNGSQGPSPTLLTTSVQELVKHADELLVECFGPTSLLVTYYDERELLTAAQSMEGQLTATVQGEENDPIAEELMAELRETAGRIIWNGWPTGVAVSWAMQHGGPYPATTSPAFTSVGTTAIRRFLRPVCYQSVPQALLPLALQDKNPLGIPRRVNGSLAWQ